MTKTPNLSEMSKDDLLDFADKRGIEVDKRMGVAKLAEAIEEALTDPARKEAPTKPATDEAKPNAPEKPAEPAKGPPRTLSNEQISEAVRVWAESFVKDIEIVGWERLDHDAAISVSVTTVHGTAVAHAEVFQWDRDGLAAALDAIREQIG